MKIKRSRCIPWIPPWATLRPSQVDALQHERQLCRLHLDVLGLGIDLHRKPERPPLEPLVEQPEAVAVPHQQLHAITAAVEEEEQVACEGIGAEAIAHDLHEKKITEKSVQKESTALLSQASP